MLAARHVTPGVRGTRGGLSEITTRAYNEVLARFGGMADDIDDITWR